METVSTRHDSSIALFSPSYTIPMSVNEINPAALATDHQAKATSDSDFEESHQTSQMMTIVSEDKDSKLSRAEEIVTSSSQQGKKKNHVQKGLVKDIIFGNSAAGDSNNRIKSEASLLDAVKMERAERALKQSQKSGEKVNHINQQPSVIQTVLGGANSTPSPATTSNPELDGKLDRADKYLSVGSTAPRSNLANHNIKAALLSPSSPKDPGSDPELGDRLNRAENILKKSHADLSHSASKSGKHGFGIMSHILGDKNTNTQQPSNSENSEIDSKLQRAENAMNSDGLRAPNIALNRNRSSSYQNIKNSLFGTTVNSPEGASRHKMQGSFDAEINEKLERADHAIQTSNLKRSHDTSNQNIKAALLGGGSDSQSHTETQPKVEEKMNRADGILKKESSAKSSQKTSPGIKASIIGAGAGEKKLQSSTDPDLQKKIDRAEKSLKVSDKAAVSAAPSVKGMSIKSSLMGSNLGLKSAESESTSKLSDTDKSDKAARAEKVIANSKTKAAPKNEKGTKNIVVTGIMGSMSNLLSPTQGKAKGSSKDKLGGS